MPYIKLNARDRLALDLPVIQTSGQLNYLLTTLVQHYLGEGYDYSDLNSAIGALEVCKLELYRRLVSPYEDEKIKENGDVY